MISFEEWFALLNPFMYPGMTIQDLMKMAFQAGTGLAAFEESNALAKPKKTDVAATLTGWEPIDTAPKDGTWIIVFRPIHDGQYIPEVSMDRWRNNGWWHSRSDTPPSMWMPMPKRPNANSPESG